MSDRIVWSRDIVVGSDHGEQKECSICVFDDDVCLLTISTLGMYFQLHMNRDSRIRLGKALSESPVDPSESREDAS